MGIDMNNDTNIRIIIDDIVSHGRDLAMSLQCMECQLQVCMAYRLSLSLKKSFISPKRFEFVENDDCPDGNRPAQSKHQLLQLWPSPEVVCDVAKFIGFAQFYSKYIHHFELRIISLRELTAKREYTNPVADIWMDACQRSFDDIREAISHYFRPMPPWIQSQLSCYPPHQLLSFRLWLCSVPTWNQQGVGGGNEGIPLGL
jgi:hypothetical protein